MQPTSSRRRGIGALDAIIGGTILSVGVVTALSLFSTSAKKSRSVASNMALLPVKEAIIADSLATVWTHFNNAAKSVTPPGMACSYNACTATFAAALPVKYVDFPAPWLAAPAAGDFLLTPVAGNATQALGIVDSAVLATGDLSTHAPVDPAYCTTTIFKNPENVMKSYVFKFQTIGMSPSDSDYASYYSFFGSLFRPYAPTAANPSPFSPPLGSLPVDAATTHAPIVNGVTTHRFAMNGTTVQKIVVSGGDGWLAMNGDPVTLPPYLGFYWAAGGGCSRKAAAENSCNTVTTPISFDFKSGDISATKLTRANAPKFAPNTLPSKALTRCASQTLDAVNFGLKDSIYFCLLFQKQTGTGFSPDLVNGMSNAFGEFVFRVRGATNSEPISCSALGVKMKAGETDYYGELAYTFFWTDTTDPKTPKPRFSSGVITRMDLL